MSSSPKVCLKTHYTQGKEIIAIADPNLLGREFRDGRICLRISEKFYGGDLVSLEDALGILRRCPNVNVVGSVVEEAVKSGIIHRDAVLWVKDRESGEKVAHLILFHV